MSEFEDKLNSILSNPEAMGQIMNLAQSLGGGQTEQPPQSDNPEGESAAGDTGFSPPTSGPSGDTGFSALGLDPKLLEMVSKLMSAYQSGDDERTALLNALRPFVRKERYAKLDQAIRIARLTRVVRLALESFRSGGGGDGHV